METISGFKFSDLLIFIELKNLGLDVFGRDNNEFNLSVMYVFKRLYQTYATYHLLGFRKIQGRTLQIFAGADTRKTIPLCVTFLIAASDCVQLYNEVKKHL